MALVKCKECGNEVSTKAESCPKCGAKAPKKTGLFTWLVVIGIGAWIFNITTDAYSDYTEKAKGVAASSPAEAKALPAKTPTKTTPEKPKYAWEYSTTKDDLEGFEIQFASIESSNSVEFEFPYHGGSKGTIMLRKSPKHGFDILFMVSKGQILCGYDDCSVTIKSGDAQPFAVSASEPADHRNDTLFLKDTKRVLAALRSGKTLKVQANFYQQGSRTYIFNPAGLEWK